MFSVLGFQGYEMHASQESRSSSQRASFNCFSEYKKNRKKQPVSLIILKSINKWANILQLKPFVYFKSFVKIFQQLSLLYQKQLWDNSFVSISWKKIGKLGHWKDEIQGHDCIFENNLLPVPERFKMKAWNIPCWNVWSKRGLLSS